MISCAQDLATVQEPEHRVMLCKYYDVVKYDKVLSISRDSRM